MANTDKEHTVSPQLSGREGNETAAEPLNPVEEASQAVKGEDDASRSVVSAEVEKNSSTVSSDVKATSSTSRPSLVQLGTTSIQPSAAAQPKRFSAVNINKKFLEKNSSASSSPTAQPAIKTGGPALARPQAQPTPSHSRLVTAKLTSTSPASPASGAGWSRPSSAAPSTAAGTHSPNNNSPPLPATSLGTSTVGAPQPPHSSKVIQPQPRAASIQSGASQKDSSGSAATKPVWGNIKPTAAPKQSNVRTDFPTAAEVAHGVSSLRTAKLNDSREAAESAAASKQARMEEADTFRGVHLDPNAHHWDEMEEDDDNFLDGVIEFGDGRQYKIETADELPPDLDLIKSPEALQTLVLRLDETIPVKEPPVSKEERFADDFDRSWPRSKTSPSSSRDVPLPSSNPGSAHVPSSPTVAQDLHSQQEASRVLFNERSNRLEPYNNAQRTGPGQHMSKRGSWQESTSPTELRSARDVSTAPQPHSIQLLQKAGNVEPQSRFRRFSGASTGNGGGTGGYNRDRDQVLRRDGPPPSPRLPKDNFVPLGRDKEPQGETGRPSRRSEMGPPPLPAHTIRGSSRDGGRQLPPHLSQLSGAAVPPQRKASRDGRFGPSASGETTIPNSSRLPSQSPVLSQPSISPSVPPMPLPQLSAPELDEARKDVMQSAAARAKQRRQQEEEEREKEKERARRKAAELEERIKVAEADKVRVNQLEVEQLAKNQEEQEVIAVIEEAINNVQLVKDVFEPQSQPVAQTTIRRLPSLKGPIPDSFKTENPKKQISIAPATGSSPPLSALSPVAQTVSWRAKATPLPLSPLPQSEPSVTSFVTPIRSALSNVDSLADGRDEELEVVDFSDMGKFMGVPEDSQANQLAELPHFTLKLPHSRPVASDFFDELHTEPGVTLAEDPRKQKALDGGSEWAAVSPREERVELNALPARDQSRSEINSDVSPPTDQAPVTLTKPAFSDHHAQTIVLPAQSSASRTSRNQSFYKEAAMSALDDAMSRIKGALDGMQMGDSTKETSSLPASDLDVSVPKISPSALSGRSNSQKDRWIPPALRVRNFDYEPREVFHVTCSEPPHSPKPAWNAFVVRLPSISYALEAINKKQLQSASKPVFQVRMDILSFEPPVDGMKPRDLSVNDVLFRKPFGGYRGKSKYRVYLPRFRLAPRVNISSHALPQKANSVGAFGRSVAADGVATWRKPAPTKPDTGDTANAESGLTTTSRSPPPDTPTLPLNSSAPSIPASMPEPLTSVKPDGANSARSRVPKMPAGSAVAFYRDSRIDAVQEDPKPSVNFIVGSELDSRQPSQVSTPSKPQPNIAITAPIPPLFNLDPVHDILHSPLVNGANGASMKEPVSSLVPSIVECKSYDEFPDRAPVTPPTVHHNSPWVRTHLTKESPARAPDPEHLKAVWSQTSNRAGSHGVNSLEGIGDDLTALPFTLQDVKSEDGETPPPSVSAVPSRMSLHDVTRAFQQVPSSSSNPTPSHRTPPLVAPPARPPNYNYGLPPPPGSLRSGYPYPSPIMSPNSGLMYPPMLPASPAPGRMSVNGHAPVFSQHMWVPIPAGSTPQSHANLMRPIASPYPAQMMPYSPGPQPIYGPQPPSNMQNAQQQNGVQANRDRNMSMMSPVLTHAGPAMYGSPVLMHAMQVPTNHAYMMPVNRNQARNDNGQVPIQNSQQQPNVHQPHPGYNPVPSSSFGRPW